MTPPRIVIYGTGQYGLRVARLAFDRGWKVVAAYNRAGAKVGRDIGSLAGIGRDVGVVVQDCDTAEYRDLEADIAIITTTNLLKYNMPAYRRMMGAGLNVLCHGAQSYFPQGNDPEAAAEIDARAKAHGVTFTGGGIWDMSRIWSGILVAGPCTRLDALYHSSITNIASQAATKEAAMLFGVGDTIEQFHARSKRMMPMITPYKTIPEHVLFALGYTIKNTDVCVEPIFLDSPLDCPLMGRTLSSGTIIGTKTVGSVETAEGVSARCEIELRLFRPGEIEHMFWEVAGLPGTRIRVERDDSAHATAASLFNRITDVMAAPPGVVPVSKLGPLHPAALPPVPA